MSHLNITAATKETFCAQGAENLISLLLIRPVLVQEVRKTQDMGPILNTSEMKGMELKKKKKRSYFLPVAFLACAYRPCNISSSFFVNGLGV